jgi:hypothetical protein
MNLALGLVINGFDAGLSIAASPGCRDESGERKEELPVAG